jgi:hypothetical protein
MPAIPWRLLAGSHAFKVGRIKLDSPYCLPHERARGAGTLAALTTAVRQGCAGGPMWICFALCAPCNPTLLHLLCASFAVLISCILTRLHLTLAQFACLLAILVLCHCPRGPSTAPDFMHVAGLCCPAWQRANKNVHLAETPSLARTGGACVHASCRPRRRTPLRSWRSAGGTPRMCFTTCTAPARAGCCFCRSTSAAPSAAATCTRALTAWLAPTLDKEKGANDFSQHVAFEVDEEEHSR